MGGRYGVALEEAVKVRVEFLLGNWAFARASGSALDLGIMILCFFCIKCMKLSISSDFFPEAAKVLELELSKRWIFLLL